MVDEPGNRSDGGQHAPDFLTVKQTADVLQLGRSTTYELVRRYVETDGAEGIPAIVFGGQYRVPRARLEELAGQRIAWPPASRERTPRSRRPVRGQNDEKALAADSAQLEQRHAAEIVAAIDERLDVDGHQSNQQRGRSASSIRLVVDEATEERTFDAEAATDQSLLKPHDSGQSSLPFAG